ncbi:MAG: polyamine aminopropyltransferase [bacterium]
MRSFKQIIFCLFIIVTISLNAKDIEHSIHWVSDENGEQYAGLHILAEFWGVEPEKLKDLDVEKLLTEAAKKADASPLEIISHKFEAPNEILPPGITSAVILEESHITIHTWLEEDGYIAVDAFTCGPKAKPQKAIEYLKDILEPEIVEIQEVKRGYKKEPLKTNTKLTTVVNEQKTFKANKETGLVDLTQVLIDLTSNKKEIETPESFTIGIDYYNDSSWFFERNIPNSEPNFKIGIKTKEKLYSAKSEFQNIEIYDTNFFGKMLVLDGIIQTTENDNFIYHEMMIHTPMFYHPNPKKVLIIGGGDGGALREVLKHEIEEVYIVEIDAEVVELCKKHIPTLSEGAFENKKTNLIIDDGKKVVKNHLNYFDVIIMDLSDPDGPAEELITEAFYQDVKKALTKNGVISIQSGSFEYQSKEIATIHKRVKSVFESVKIHKAVVPTYQGGEFSFMMAAKFDLSSVTEKEIKEKFKLLNLQNLKYYSPEIHFASAILPKYLQDIFK